MAQSVSPPTTPPSRALNPPQFRLRTLLVAITAICVTLAVMVAIGKAWAIALLMLLLLIVAHVAGNAVGTRLRDGEVAAESAKPPVADPFTQAAVQATIAHWRPPAASRMQVKLPVGWWLMGLGLMGGIAGAAAGGAATFVLYGARAGIASVAVAVISCAILGGIAAFMTGTFVDMVRRVWRETTVDPGRSEATFSGTHRHDVGHN